MKLQRTILTAALVACSYQAGAQINDSRYGTPGELIISIWDPTGAKSYAKDLGITTTDLVAGLGCYDNTLSTDPNFATFNGVAGLLYNIAGVNTLLPDASNAAQWGYVGTSATDGSIFSAVFASIDNTVQKIQGYEARLNNPPFTGSAAQAAVNSSVVSQSADIGYHGGPAWGTSFGQSVGGDTEGTVGAPLNAYFVNNFTGDNTGKVVQLLGNWTLAGNGNLSWSNASGSKPCNITSAKSKLRDFNADGKTDVVWTSGPFWYMNGVAAPVALAKPALPTGVTKATGWVVQSSHDFDADGLADQLLTKPAADGSAKVDVSLWLSSYNATTKVLSRTATNLGAYGAYSTKAASNKYKPDTAWQNATGWSVKGTGDFNGDRRNDILWKNITTGDFKVWYLNGTAAPVEAAIGTQADLTWDIVNIGDYNGDKKADLLWSKATGEQKLQFLNGNKIVSEYALPTLAGWTEVGGGDFNADGIDDAVYGNTSTGAFQILEFKGAAVPAVLTLPTGPAGARIADVGDYDADGKADLFWRNETTGANEGWLMNENAILAKSNVCTTNVKTKVTTCKNSFKVLAPPATVFSK